MPCEEPRAEGSSNEKGFLFPKYLIDFKDCLNDYCYYERLQGTLDHMRIYALS